MKSFILVSLVTGSLCLSAVANAQKDATNQEGIWTNTSITSEEVKKMQEAWGRGFLHISKENKKAGFKAAQKSAEGFLDQVYDYKNHPVLFKPTLTSGNQVFRTDREGALAYFVGKNKSYPNDLGFALNPWEKFEYKNVATHINGNIALTMGNAYLTDSSGKVTKVDKTWGFRKDEKGQLRIVLHHSSLPYEPK